MRKRDVTKPKPVALSETPQAHSFGTVRPVARSNDSDSDSMSSRMALSGQRSRGKSLLSNSLLRPGAVATIHHAVGGLPQLVSYLVCKVPALLSPNDVLLVLLLQCANPEETFESAS